MDRMSTSRLDPCITAQLDCQDIFVGASSVSDICCKIPDHRKSLQTAEAAKGSFLSKLTPLVGSGGRQKRWRQRMITAPPKQQQHYHQAIPTLYKAVTTAQACTTQGITNIITIISKAGQWQVSNYLNRSLTSLLSSDICHIICLVTISDICDNIKYLW